MISDAKYDSETGATTVIGPDGRQTVIPRDISSHTYTHVVSPSYEQLWTVASVLAKTVCGQTGLRLSKAVGWCLRPTEAEMKEIEWFEAALGAKNVR